VIGGKTFGERIKGKVRLPKAPNPNRVWSLLFSPLPPKLQTRGFCVRLVVLLEREDPVSEKIPLEHLKEEERVLIRQILELMSDGKPRTGFAIKRSLSTMGIDCIHISFSLAAMSVNRWIEDVGVVYPAERTRQITEKGLTTFEELRKDEGGGNEEIR
jgi:hypothetical protein